MASKLKKRDKTETLEFEVFELDLDGDEQQQLADDPRGFLTNLLKEEGQVVNDLLVAADEKFLKPDGATTDVVVTDGTDVRTDVRTDAAGATTSIWHCKSPASMRSKWITIIQ